MSYDKARLVTACEILGRRPENHGDAEQMIKDAEKANPLAFASTGENLKKDLLIPPFFNRLSCCR